MRVMSNGRATVPKAPGAAGAAAGTEVELEPEGNAARVIKTRHPAGETAASGWYDAFGVALQDRSMTRGEE